VRRFVIEPRQRFPGSGYVDVVHEDGRRQTLFNGDMNAQHLTSAKYDEGLPQQTRVSRAC
jgi:hypothetical protein